MSADLLEQMRRNPLGDWTISDVEKVCRAHGLWFRGGRGTSHCHAKHPSAVEILTIPARRPIKPVYIRKLVRYIDVHGGPVLWRKRHKRIERFRPTLAA